MKGEIRSLSVRAPLFLVWALGPAELHAGGYYERYLTQELAAAFDVSLDDLPVEVGRLNNEGCGLLAGAGVRFGHFYAGVRYNLGMSDLGNGPFLEIEHHAVYPPGSFRWRDDCVQRWGFQEPEVRDILVFRHPGFGQRTHTIPSFAQCHSGTLFTHVW